MKVSDIITHVTLNTINGVIISSYPPLLERVQRGYVSNVIYDGIMILRMELELVL